MAAWKHPAPLFSGIIFLPGTVTARGVRGKDSFVHSPWVRVSPTTKDVVIFSRIRGFSVSSSICCIGQPS